MGAHVRVSGLREDLLTKVAATPALDAVQVVVDPKVPIPVSQHFRARNPMETRLTHPHRRWSHRYSGIDQRRLVLDLLSR